MQKISFLIFLSVVIFACGEPTVEIGENNYSPKIVVEGYLFPNRKVENIRISRNIPLNSTTQIKRDSLIIKNATVKINDVQLNFNENKKSYEAEESALTIVEGGIYKLEVSAKIDGKELSTTSKTEVPQRNGSKFEILSINFDSLFYRERDTSGELKNFEITCNTALNSENGSYVLGLTALDADSSNVNETFIFDNIFADLDAEDVLKDFDDFKNSYDVILNFTTDSTKVIKKEVEWFYTWFYGNYRLILFAGDKNFKDFMVTYGDVQEEDGNFHEPAFHLEGDGIGVFGSALADTIYFKILKK